MNLVRLRYREPVSFLTLSSISAQFSYTANANVIAQAQKQDFNFGIGSDNPLFTYSEQPTITYAPLQGAEFATRIMRDIDLETFGLLATSQWDVNILMRLLAEKMGRLPNKPEDMAEGEGSSSSYAKFMTVMRIWKNLQNHGRLVFAKVPDDEAVVTESLPASQITADSAVSADKSGYALTRRKDGAYDLVKSGATMFCLMATYFNKEDADTVDACLGIKPLRRQDSDDRIVERIKIVRASDVPMTVWTEPTLPVLPIQFRSFLNVMQYVAAGIEAPESDIQKQVVKTYTNSGGKPFDRRELTKDLLDIRCSQHQPKSAFVWIRYRGHYFYIDDADVASKDAFAFIGLIFSLYAGAPSSASPLLTIPVGGR
jgi:hypothetical protein